MNSIAIINDEKIQGFIKFHQCNEQANTFVEIKLSGFKPFAEHAMHIHEYGDMSKGCESCGGHFNPYNVNHGSGEFRHVGDLINNITADRNGNVNLKFFDNLVNLSGPNSINGRSIMIHEGIDDLGLGETKESLTTGSAGGRMTCAIIGVAAPSKCRAPTTYNYDTELEWKEYLNWDDDIKLLEGVKSQKSFISCECRELQTWHPGQVEHKLKCEKFWRLNPGKTKQDLLKYEGFA